MITDIEKLVEVLKNKKEKGAKEYHFRPYSIDGVFCYIVLYFKYSIFTVESVNVKCKYTYEGQIFNQPYVLYHRKYKTIMNALELIQKVTTKYKILNGDLESPENYEELKLEECILPYSENEKCSVCFENTTDTTLCDHYICFNCREKCILKNQPNCPICRNENIIKYYNNNIGLFNNRDTGELSRIFIKDRYKYSFNSDLEDNDTESSDSDSENHALLINIVNEENPDPFIDIVNEENHAPLIDVVNEENHAPLIDVVNEENHAPLIDIINEENPNIVNNIHIINDFDQI